MEHIGTGSAVRSSLMRRRTGSRGWSSARTTARSTW